MVLEVAEALLAGRTAGNHRLNPHRNAAKGQRCVIAGLEKSRGL
jgi:hypothetical protein